MIVLTSPFVGALVDRIGPRRPFVGGLVVYGVGGGAGLLVDEFLPLLLPRVVLGVGTAAVYTGVTVLIYELYEDQAMEQALGYRSSANSAGAAVWPLVGGAAGTLAWNLPFGVYLVALPLGLLAAATVPETRSRDDTPRSTAIGNDATAGVGTRVAATLTVLRDRPALSLATCSTSARTRSCTLSSCSIRSSAPASAWARRSRSACTWPRTGPPGESRPPRTTGWFVTSVGRRSSRPRSVSGSSASGSRRR